MTKVAELLGKSQAAHRAYRELDKLAQVHQRRVSKEVKLPLLREAAEYRAQAHALDPQHTDPVWAAEQGSTHAQADTHTALVAFYQQQGVWPEEVA